MNVRTLIVDDSVVVRRTVATVLEAAGGIEVVGTARDGRVGIEQIERLRPDVVTLDVEMPDLDGLQTLALIRQRWPSLPVIMYSSLTERGADVTLTALMQGANDFATKPAELLDRAAVSRHIEEKLAPLVRAWGGTAAIRSGVPRDPAPPDRVGNDTRPAPAAVRASETDLVVLGVSTGGPDALATVVPQLPGGLSAPVVIVQHMPAVFTAMLARRLDAISTLSVSEVTEAVELRPGHVYLAAGGRHVVVGRTANGLRVMPDDGPPEQSCRPAVDVLFRSAATATGSRTLAVVLTGMGQDGLDGSGHIRRAGGRIVVQDEQSSVVWGMPGYIARAGLADSVVPLNAVAAAIASTVGVVSNKSRVGVT